MKSRMFVLGLLLAVIAAGTWMRWDQGRAAAAVEGAGLAGITAAEAGERPGAAIPEDAIRLRVLANSDTDGDQRVKRLVRDRIVEQLNGWLRQQAAPQTREEAREFIAGHLEELERTVTRALAEEGMPYSAELTLGEVPFPAKLYGGQVYPAGMYEALLVTLGAGEGQNWWCVLFPPLCFIDGDTGQAKADSGAGSEGDSSAAAGQDGAPAGEASGTAGMDGGSAVSGAEPSTDDGTEVRFFLWDMLVSLFLWLAEVWNALIG
ncbi:stage II sporulation protein R [Paenibacillus dendritiformis]|uniref:stage II sporulation protein R n=1 Tax=Paenibacillus dendritiformis TaxID=130049 RepID=UPI0018CCC43D|nr:stage II sporulation protein R [Paenibacillus dendritiformis]MBG9794254.1 stage II sporulation protein R [Paenibacillus dendritiformis]